ncbi:MAG: type II toxin-antitoxin system RelE/ParE family toxin [Methylobacter sp.]|nr:type II toxin-antitoxin system RelE/ParE family toxin [Methylobacter sp.]MDP2100752.1 type II toxin-antitoxin system RelE/ParE family toxin [Methylobacter sp.]MDP2429894.1 type II toxin-antitoxin system RelE/ParE family toxin [Methylobacter sp.]MDP3056081.1 type II toxin-antitoxin system RelE/ParE family toxin [Methylobacter sp.]MDP3362851.1 type II toxin-antitoxin system RelE/ParE family toxin [Methylobacter sp.]
MAYEIIIKPSTEKSFARLEKAQQIKIVKAIENLAANPRPQGFKKLKSDAELYRIRVGDYRIIYSIDNNVLIITVVKVGHRKDIYK